MKKLGYTDTEFDRHVEEHRKYHGEMRDLAKDSLKTKGSLTHEKIKTAQKWFREHITSSDKHYLAFFGPARGAPALTLRPILIRGFSG